MNASPLPDGSAADGAAPQRAQAAGSRPDRAQGDGALPDGPPAAIAWPDGAALLALERRARRGGSGLNAALLQGCWQLQQVWPRNGLRPAAWNSLLLRSLGARLEIAAGQRDGDLQLCNAVRWAGLELRFRGHGRLQGARPLLCFQFERLELALGDRILLQRSLPTSEPRRQPFFALIARDASGWLAARGRGGGLALWSLQAAGGG